MIGYVSAGHGVVGQAIGKEIQPQLAAISDEFERQLERLHEAIARTDCGLDRMGAPCLQCEPEAATAGANAPAPPSALRRLELLSASLREAINRVHDNASRLDRVV